MILLDLFFTFLKVGLFTFGGGYAMLPMIREEVLAHGWLTMEELIDFIAVSESTPGPFAVNIATFVGTQCGGVPGALCATLGVVLPSFIILLTVAHFLAKFQKSLAVKGVLRGLKPAVVGLIGSAILSVAGTVFLPGGTFSVSPVLLLSAGIFSVSCVLLFWKKIHPIYLILGAAAVGIAGGYAFGL